MRDDFVAMFAAIGPDIALAVDRLGVLESGPIGDGLAEYVLVRNDGGAARIFFLYFGRGDDGLWRIRAM